MPPVNPLAQLQSVFAKKPLMGAPRPALGGGVQEPNSADLYNFNGALGDEYFERAQMADMAGDQNAVSPLMRLFAKTQQERALSPIPQKQAEYDQFNTDNRSAIMEGFGEGAPGPQVANGYADPMKTIPSFTEHTPNVSPIVARNLYKRQMAQEQMRQPIQQQAMQERGATQRTQLQGQAQQNVADINATGQIEQEKIRQAPQHEFNALQKMLYAPDGGQGGGGLPPGASVGRNSMRQSAAPSQGSQMNQMAAVRGLLSQENGGAPVYLNYTNPSRYQAAYNQMAGNFMSQAVQSGRLDPQAAQLINKVMSDPKTAFLPLDQLFTWDSQEEYAALIQIMSQLRGDIR